MSAFYNSYDDLRTAEPGTPFFSPTPVPHIVVPLLTVNGGFGETYGVELAADWRPTQWLRLAAAYSFLDIQRHRKQGSLDPGFEPSEGEAPEQQVNGRAYFDITDSLEFDVAAYWVDSLSTKSIDSYIRLDARIGWRPTYAAELSIGVQNILDDRHPEAFGQPFTSPTEAERTFFAELTLRF